MAKIVLSVPALDSTYSRTFESEIDVLTANEILVCGRMRDHRFEIEHRWVVRTPAYEVIEAAALQHLGDRIAFDPELCTRYASIAGVLIGRGFSKRVLSALGNLPGAQEQLFLAIEMARVAQQVYQFPAEFESQFAAPPDDTKTPAAQNSPLLSPLLSWMKDRAYMPDLQNSCYTYRDESAALFATRDVRLGFGEELYTPKPGDKRVFWRTKDLRIAIKQDANGGDFYTCESAMDDRIHDIKIGFEISASGMITNAQSRGMRLPYHGICEDAQQRTAGLNGMRATAGFILQFADRVGGASGCTHLFDLSIDVLRLFKFD